ncbi:hypothetical protein B7494_g6468 [Chlorociboria aeruginascens]|nr:hypothetical protein B7494_g6468 [Chlorociboria aeruginascens]
MDDTPLASLSLTHVHYNPNDPISYFCAWLALVPQGLCVVYATLVWSTREIEILLMFGGQLACEALNFALKRLLKEERPSRMHGKGYGMPSSHSQFVAFFSISLTLFLLFRHQPKRPTPSHTPLSLVARIGLSALALVLPATFSYLILLSLLLLASHGYVVWRRLKHIPGPFSASTSKLWMLHHTLAGQLPFALKAVSDKYGKLVRVGPNQVVTSDPEVLHKIWAARSPYQRGDFYKAMKIDSSRDNLLSLTHDARHTELKAKLALGYSGKDVEGLEGIINERINTLVCLIDSKYISSTEIFRPLDFAYLAQYFTLDVISTIAFGAPFGYLTANSDVYSFIKSSKRIIPVVTLISVFPWIGKMFQLRIFRSLMPSPKDETGFGKFMSIAESVVAQRFGPNRKVVRDMMGSFIAHGITQEQAISESLLQMFALPFISGVTPLTIQSIAGSDTTAIAIRTTLLHIITSPIVYSTLLSEIMHAISNDLITSPITDVQSRTLLYLQAVIKEGLRILPPGTGFKFKVVPRGGDILNDFFVPGGTEVGYNALGVHHSKVTFGDDADMFRPERWLEQKDEMKLKKMNEVVELGFSYGRWTCPGKNIAKMELNKIFVELLRRFDFTVVNPMIPWKMFYAGVFIQSKMILRVTRREH